MKKLVYLILFASSFLFSDCKSRIAKNTIFVPYKTIRESKEKKAFLTEYSPQDSLIEIGGKKFDILEAWAEQPHLEKDFNDEVLQGSIFVANVSMNERDFSEAAWRNMDIHHYVKEEGYGNSQIWFYLSEPEGKLKDTITVHYRHPSNFYEQKGFVFLKKK